MDLTYCRLCLQLSKHEFSVFDLIATSNDGCLKLSDMIYISVNLMITKNDNLIHNICDPCINDVIRCYNFRRKCHESDKLLNMKIGGILNEHREIRIKIEHNDGNFVQDTASQDAFPTKDDSERCDIKVPVVNNTLNESQNKIIAENPSPSPDPEISTRENDIFLKDLNSELEIDILKDLNEIEFNKDKAKNNGNESSTESLEIKECDQKFQLCDRNELSSYSKGKRVYQYKCTVCLKNFKNITLLRLHSELHSERNNYLCGICGQGFKQKQCLRAHNVRKHTARFKCHICSKTYVGNSQLLAHMRGHTGEKPFSCEICGSSFARKYSVDIHMRTHTGERPFKCRYCDKTFIMHSHRRNHELNHIDPGQTEKFLCVVCLKSFNRKDLYNSHLKVHSEERNEKCKYCTKKFKSRKSLSSHVRHIHNVNKEK